MDKNLQEILKEYNIKMYDIKRTLIYSLVGAHGLYLGRPGISILIWIGIILILGTNLKPLGTFILFYWMYEMINIKSIYINSSIKLIREKTKEKFAKIELKPEVTKFFDEFFNNNKSLGNLFFINLRYFNFKGLIFPSVIRSIFIFLILITAAIKLARIENEKQLEKENENLIYQKNQFDFIVKNIKENKLDKAVNLLPYVNNDVIENSVDLLSNNERMNIFSHLNKLYYKEYKEVNKNLTKSEKLESQINNLKFYSNKAFVFAISDNQRTKSLELFNSATYLVPAGSSNEAVSLCKDKLTTIYGYSVDIDDSFLLRAAANKVVGEIIGNENNENYTMIAWPTSIVGKNIYGMDVRNQVRCEVKFNKIKNKGLPNYTVSPKVSKLIVGNKIIRY